MSMHLAYPNLTTTTTKKRKTKVTKAQQEDLERGWRDRNVRLKQMGLQKESFEQYLVWVYGKGKKDKAETTDRAKSSKAVTTKIADQGKPNIGADSKYNIDWSGDGNSKDDYSAQSGNSDQNRRKVWVTGPCTTKQTPTYTGTQIIGICQMAKSNAIPVFNQTEIIDIARMRR